jgi:hypothetical protein
VREWLLVDEKLKRHKRHEIKIFDSTHHLEPTRRRFGALATHTATKCNLISATPCRSSLQHEASDERMDTNLNVPNTNDATSRGGLNAAAAKWRINYFVVGKEFPFLVDVEPETTVGELKKLINTELELVAHKETLALRLYLLNIPDGTKLAKRANDELATKGEDDVLLMTDELRDHYPASPPKRNIHILVKPPSPSEFLHTDLRRITRLTKPSRHNQPQPRRMLRWNASADWSLSTIISSSTRLKGDRARSRRVYLWTRGSSMPPPVFPLFSASSG